MATTTIIKNAEVPNPMDKTAVASPVQAVNPFSGLTGSKTSEVQKAAVATPKPIVESAYQKQQNEQALKNASWLSVPTQKPAPTTQVSDSSWIGVPKTVPSNIKSTTTPVTPVQTTAPVTTQTVAPLTTPSPTAHGLNLNLTGDDTTGTLDVNTAQTVNGQFMNPNDPDPVKANLAKQAILAYNQNVINQNKAIRDTNQSYVLNQSNYEKNKAYTTNFDPTNELFNKTMNARIEALRTNPGGQLTDQQAQQIASQTGVSIDEVKDPNKIWNRIQYTAEGEQKLGISKYNQQMEDAQVQYQRQLEDAKVSLDNTTKNYENQIADVQKQLERNINWMTAQGAWSGAGRSSGYVTGIENVRQDGQATINRLKSMLESVKTANATDVARLTEDYNKAVSRAKSDFDTQLSELNQSIGTQLNSATATYGIGSTELAKQLSDITAKYGANSMEITSKYLGNLKSVNDLTNQNIENTTKMMQLQDQVANKRYNEYLANNGQILQSSSFNTIANDVNTGKISYEKAQDLKNVLTNSIMATLSKSAAPSQSDIDTVNHLLQSGKTASEVVAQMQTMEKFKPKTTIEKTFDVGGQTWVQYSDGKIEKVANAESMKPIAVGEGSQLYDPKTGTWITKPTPTSAPAAAGVISTSTFSTTAQPSKKVSLDANALAGFTKAFDALKAQGIETVIGSTFRTKEEQQALYDAYKSGTGGIAAAPGTSKHESGTAIDIYSDSKLSPPTPEQIAVMEANGWKHMGIAGDMGHFEYVGSSTTPVDANTVSRIMGRLPTQLKNSEAERELAEKNAIRMLTSGMSEQDVLDNLFGIDKSKIPAENRAPVLGVLRRLPQDSQLNIIATFGENPTQGIIALEDAINNKAKTTDPDGFISDRITGTVVRRSNELNDLVKKLESTDEGKKNPLGTFKGSIEDWLGRFKSADAVQVANNASRLVQDFRKLNLGSAVTPAEEAFLTDVMPRIFDSTENFTTKVNEFKNQAVGQYNDYRRVNGLPELGEGAIVKPSNRRDYYLDVAEAIKNTNIKPMEGVGMSMSIGSPKSSAPVSSTQDAWTQFLQSKKK